MGEPLPAWGGGLEQEVEMKLIVLCLLFGKWSSAPALILGVHLSPACSRQRFLGRDIYKTGKFVSRLFNVESC